MGLSLTVSWGRGSRHNQTLPATVGSRTSGQTEPSHASFPWRLRAKKIQKALHRQMVPPVLGCEPRPRMWTSGVRATLAEPDRLSRNLLETSQRFTYSCLHKAADSHPDGLRHPPPAFLLKRWPVSWHLLYIPVLDTVLGDIDRAAAHGWRTCCALQMLQNVLSGRGEIDFFRMWYFVPIIWGMQLKLV